MVGVRPVPSARVKPKFNMLLQDKIERKWDIVENDLNVNELDRFSFGAFIRKKREAEKLTLRTVAEELQISAAHLGDIERGDRRAPNKEEFLSKLFQILNVTPIEERNLRTMLLISRRDGVDEYLSKTPLAKVALRLADETGASDEVWKEFMNRLYEMNEEKLSEG